MILTNRSCTRLRALENREASLEALICEGARGWIEHAELRERMVDRAYKADLPRLKKALEELKEEFSNLGSSKTNWTKLRIEPLLKHLDSLEELLRSEEFSRESSHLRKGVAMFHSHLVYLRENVKALEKVLQSEKKSLKK
jgi:predicted  nucleic acid-binding Zn-ribbon protein